MKLSVLMITYNHEGFIARAIESVLAQKVNFEIEVVVGEDFSKDKTRDILLGYRDRFPDKIKLLLPNHNLGMNRNFVSTFEACTGEYVAMLEGDDFWSSPHKLQAQVDLLDQNKDCSMCFHDVIQFNHSTGQASPWVLRSRQSRYCLEDLLQGNFIPTGAVVFRRSLIERFPDFAANLGMLDWLINVLLARFGSIAFIDQIMGVYSIHDGGVWSSKSRLGVLKSSVHAAREMTAIIEPKYKSILQNTINIWDQAISQMGPQDSR